MSYFHTFSPIQLRQIKTNFMAAVHYFHLTKGFQKNSDYSTIYQLERHLTVFHIRQIVPSFVVLYLNDGALLLQEYIC